MSRPRKTATVGLLVLVLICAAYLIGIQQGRTKSVTDNMQHAAHCLQGSLIGSAIITHLYDLCMIERGVDKEQAKRLAEELGYHVYK